ncbi:LysM peptidoglycan-binding domain-containing protein [Thioclava atlantica]|uniref:LysM domain-containing protein n=1 Tax=Thioclava atlantica TaxID=1317124 RepID=A0A085U1W7_9RHOB|nr:LysM peptidoglycan-binding domain-containing protein [Thioclava atlantica]KFE36964.1 LysM domain-containing protein [Thioclava atlantica]
MAVEEKKEVEGGATAATLKGGALAIALVVLALIGWALMHPGEEPATKPGTETTEAQPAPATRSAEAPVPAAQHAAPDTAPAATKTETAPPESIAETGAEPATSAAAPQEEPAAAISEQAATGPGQTAPAPTGESRATEGADASTGATDLAQVQFDALRASPDGSVTLAGRTDPGAKVDVLVDGQVVANTETDGAGNFASLFDLPPSAGPRALSLRVTGANGVAKESAESLVLRGQPGAETVAAADMAETPQTTPPATPAPPAAPIVADASGARLLAPKSQSLVIDTIAFGAGEIARSEGRGAPDGSQLAAYLDDTLVAEAKAGADGRWALDLPGLTPGAHKLRIDAHDGEGKVIARAETDFDQPDQIVVASSGDPAKSEADAVQAAGGDGNAVKVVQIVKGNTLWAIAREVYGEGILYVRVFDANRDQIRDPDLIYPGQVFTIPAPQ